MTTKLLILTALIFSSFAIANSPSKILSQETAKFEHLSVADGLSQSSVHCIFQDSRGFMWFGTLHGLNRYDGYNFTMFHHSPDDSSTLVNDRIQTIIEDRLGNLWIGTIGGVSCLLQESGTFLNYHHDPQNENSLGSNYIISILQDRSGGIWIGTRNGLDYLLPNTSGDFRSPEFRHFKHDSTDATTLSSNTVIDLLEDRSGTLWIATINGLNRLDRAGETFQQFHHDPQNAESLSSDVVLKIFEPPFTYDNPKTSKSETLWIGTANAFNRFDVAKESFTVYHHNPQNSQSLGHRFVRDIAQSSDGLLWLATANGVDIFDPRTEMFRHLRHNPAEPASLRANYVWDIEIDRSGIVWVGTSPGGINKLVRRRKKFSLIEETPGTDNTLSDNFVFSILEDRRQNLWIGTWNGGLNRLERSDQNGKFGGKFTHYWHQPGNPESLPSNTVYALEEDRSGILWIGTSQGLSRLSRNEQRQGNFTTYVHNPTDPTSLCYNWVYAIREDFCGDLWVGTENGLSRLKNGNRRQGKFISYKNDSGVPGSLSHNLIQSIYESSDSVLWIATNGGLNRFNRETGTFSAFRHAPQNPNSISHDKINTIYEMLQQPGILWLTTQGGGLCRFDVLKEEFTQYNLDGVPASQKSASGNIFYGLLADENQNLWLSGTQGLVKFDSRTATFRRYHVSDGLQGPEFSPGAFFKSPGGEMFFGGVNGVNHFYPGAIEDNPHVPPIVITDFKIFDQSIAANEVANFLTKDQSNKILLDYWQNFFSFEFAALDYTNPANNQFKYRLEGLDSDWIYCGTRRYASYTNLDPGEYIFHVSGANSDAVWNETGISLPVVIRPPFWRTYWFYLLCGLFLTAILAVIHVFRVRQKIRQLAEIEGVRKKAAADFHDELGHKLTKISLYSEAAKSSVADERSELKEFLEEINDASGSLYQETRDFIWSLDPGKDSLYELVLYLKDFGDELFHKTGIAFRVEGISNSLRNKALSMDQKQHLTRIFKEAMHNVLKHSQAKNVTLTVALTESVLTLQLIDDGAGFNDSGNGAKNFTLGQGLKNMNQRAETLGGNLEILSETGKGTAIRFFGK